MWFNISCIPGWERSIKRHDHNIYYFYALSRISNVHRTCYIEEANPLNEARHTAVMLRKLGVTSFRVTLTHYSDSLPNHFLSLQNVPCA